MKLLRENAIAMCAPGIMNSSVRVGVNAHHVGELAREVLFDDLMINLLLGRAEFGDTFLSGARQVLLHLRIDAEQVRSVCLVHLVRSRVHFYV